MIAGLCQRLIGKTVYVPPRLVWVVQLRRAAAEPATRVWPAMLLLISVITDGSSPHTRRHCGGHGRILFVVGSVMGPLHPSSPRLRIKMAVSPGDLFYCPLASSPSWESDRVCSRVDEVSVVVALPHEIWFLHDSGGRLAVANDYVIIGFLTRFLNAYQEFQSIAKTISITHTTACCRP